MTCWMMMGAATVLKMIQKPTAATPMVFCRSGSVEVGSRYSKLGSVMKSRMPCVTSAATAQPNGQSKTPTRFKR